MALLNIGTDNTGMNRHSLVLAVGKLCQHDVILKRAVSEFGYPLISQRPQTFDTLIHITLEQKVSLASALAVMQRLRKLDPVLSPNRS